MFNEKDMDKVFGVDATANRFQVGMNVGVTLFSL